MPEANETVRLADGDVMVAILRIPSACALHRFTLFLFPGLCAEDAPLVETSAQ
jgi:hypothetical protein